MMNKKLVYLDGLRGLAALIVVFHHYILGFYPIYGVNKVSTSPISILYDGNFSVCVFFILSGFVLSSKFIKTKEYNVLIAGATKRYFRLLPPVFLSIFLGYLALRFSLFSNTEVARLTGSSWLAQFYTFPPNKVEMLQQGLYRVFLNGESSYNTNLWTINIEFLGSMLTFSFLALFGKMKNRYIIYSVIFVTFYTTYYLAFFLGIFLSDLYYTKSTKILFMKNKFILLLIFLFGIYFGSFPYGPPTDKTIYSILDFTFLKAEHFEFYHIIGAFILIYVLLSSKLLQRVFSHKIMQFMGKISFSLYALHLFVLCSFSTFLFKVLYTHLSFKISFILMFLCSLVILLPLSYLSYKYADLPGVKLGNQVYLLLKGDNRIVEKNEVQHKHVNNM